MRPGRSCSPAPLRNEVQLGFKQVNSIIGSGALMLQASYERGSTNSDIFETTDLGHANESLPDKARQ